MKTTLITALIMAATTSMASANEPTLNELYDAFQAVEANVESTEAEIAIASNAFFAPFWEVQSNYYEDAAATWKGKYNARTTQYTDEIDAHEATTVALTAEIAEGTVALEEINAKITTAENASYFKFGAMLAASKEAGTYKKESFDEGMVFSQVVTPVSGSYKTVTSLSVTGKYHDFDINTDGLKIHGSQANQIKFSVLVNDINEAAYNEGYSDGYNDGYQDGFNVGWDSAIASVK